MKALLPIFPLLILCQSSVAEPSWEDLRKGYEQPAWFADAKLGIWVHWGPQAVPVMGGGWYARHMYMPDVGTQTFGKNAYGDHLKNFGHPSEKGYKEVIRAWKAEKLNADELISYYKEVGAKYIMVLANHHDHFDLFNSTHHQWNSVNLGPKKDIVGEFEKAIRKHGLKFGVSSHDDRFLDWWLPAFSSDLDGPKKGVPYDGNDTLADGKGQWWEGYDPAKLHGLPPEKRTPEWIEWVGENFVARHEELVTNYQPDLLWFDGYGFPYEKHGVELSRRFYAASQKKHGTVKVAVAGKFENEPSTIRDIERGVSEKILPEPWQGTTTFTSWFYKHDEPVKHDARSLIEVLIDTVSKNGNLLLNVELLPDGTIPPEQKVVLEELRGWLDVNGIAIFKTRPWKTHGDNLNSIQKRLEAGAINAADVAALQKKAAKGHFNERTKDSESYGADEVRFTTLGDRFFVFVMNPQKGKLTLPVLKDFGPVKAVTLVGSEEEPRFHQEKEHLWIEVPEKLPTQYAVAFELRR